MTNGTGGKRIIGGQLGDSRDTAVYLHLVPCHNCWLSFYVALVDIRLPTLGGRCLMQARYNLRRYGWPKELPVCASYGYGASQRPCSVGNRGGWCGTVDNPKPRSSSVRNVCVSWGCCPVKASPGKAWSPGPS